MRRVLIVFAIAAVLGLVFWLLWVSVELLLIFAGVLLAVLLRGLSDGLAQWTKIPPGWSLLSASAHKWGGPPGVGVLVVRKGVRWQAPYPTDERHRPRPPGAVGRPAGRG